MSLNAHDLIKSDDFNWTLIVDSVNELLMQLNEEGYFNLEVRQHEDQEGADYYCNQTITKHYLNKTKKEQWQSFAADLHYWSDRWCYSRAYTCGVIWDKLYSNEEM